MAWFLTDSDNLDFQFHVFKTHIGSFIIVLFILPNGCVLVYHPPFTRNLIKHFNFVLKLKLL